MRSIYTIYRCSWTFYDVLHLSTRAHKVHMTLLWAFSSWGLSACRVSFNMSSTTAQVSLSSTLIFIIVNSAHLDHLGFGHQGPSSQHSFQFHSPSCRRWGVIYPLPNGVSPGGPNPEWTVNNSNLLNLPAGLQVRISSLTILQTILTLTHPSVSC